MKSAKRQNNKFDLVVLSSRKSTNNEVVGGNTYYFGHDTTSFEDTVIMHRDAYKDIFGVDRNKARPFRKRVSVLRITYNDSKEKHTIYRKFRPCYDYSMRDKVAITYHSVLFLKTSDDDILGNKVTVLKSTLWNYYWNHPNEIVHTSIILAGVSVFLGFLSIILAIVL